MPDSTVPGTLDLPAGKFLVRRLQFLLADDVGLRLVQPAKQHVEPSVAVDVVRGELHPSVLAIALVALARLRVVFGIVARIG